MRRVAVVFVAVACACGKYDGNNGDAPLPDRGDAGDDAATEGGAVDAGDAGTDAAVPACDVTKPFGAPTRIEELSTSDSDGIADMSADELVAYVWTNHAGSGVHLYSATRATRASAFGPTTSLFPIGAWDDWSVAVSPDGLTAVVASSRSGSAGVDLYVATRANVLAAFGPLGPTSGVDSPQDDQAPRWSGDGKTLYFDTSRAGSRDLYRAPTTLGGFGAAAPLDELNTVDLEATPVLTPDELTIYFLSQRPPAADGDIWVATRAGKADKFGAPTRVTELNSPKLDVPTFVSADGCRLYLVSDRGGSLDPWVATRPR